MSVLIKGMEMPKSCDKCIYSAWSYFYLVYVCNAVKKNEPVLFDGKLNKSTAVARSARADNCPLVSVPTPHGRLIDADAMEQLMSDTVQGDIRQYPYSDTQWETAFEWIDHQPTIIEADKDINVLCKEGGEI